MRTLLPGSAHLHAFYVLRVVERGACILSTTGVVQRVKDLFGFVLVIAFDFILIRLYVLQSCRLIIQMMSRR